MKNIRLFLCFMLLAFTVHAEDGYRLWLRYNLVDDQQMLQQYRNAITGISLNGTTPTLQAAREELSTALEGLLGRKVSVQREAANGSIVAGTPASSPLIATLSLQQQLARAGTEGFVISWVKSKGKSMIAIAA